MADQFRYDALGTVSDWMKTPTLDKLCKMGVSFSSCYTNSPTCIPARFSLATGARPKHLQIDRNIEVDLYTGGTFWTRSIQNAGYTTAVIGKTHLHRHRGDLRDRQHLLRDIGFDHVNEIAGPRASAYTASNMTDLWDKRGYLQPYIDDLETRYSSTPYISKPSVLPLELYTDCYVGEMSANHLEAVDEDKPWFLWTSFAGPHEPWDAPEPYASMYDPALAPEPVGARESTDKNLPAGSVHEKRQTRKSAISSDEIAMLRANYAGNVSLIDDQIKKLIDILAKRNMLDDTIIIFTSDHGEMNGDHGLIYKDVFFESAVKIPVIISTPEHRLNKEPETHSIGCDALLQLSDVGPTILELIGLEAEPSFSRSFASCVSGESETHRQFVVSDLAGESMLLTTDWKIVFDPNNKPYMMFDRVNDPHEEFNVVRSPLLYFKKRELTKMHKMAATNL